MGEAADMLLDGHVDHMGEYTGDWHDNSYVPCECAASKRNHKIRNYMRQRGITTARSQKRTLKAYGEALSTDRPTYHAYHNWGVFKEFVNNRVGYKKNSPSHE